MYIHVLYICHICDISQFCHKVCSRNLVRCPIDGQSIFLLNILPPTIENKEPFTLRRVFPTRILEEDQLSLQFRLAESHYLRLSSPLDPQLISVDIIENTRLKTVFEATKRELSKKGLGDSVLLFHGTPKKNTVAIARDNFDLRKVSNGRCYGDGVYFSVR